MRISYMLVPLVLITGACSSDSPDGGGDDDEGDVDAARPPGCGDGDVSAEEACDDGNADAFDGCTNQCEAVAALDAPAGQWTYVEIPGTRCLDGSPAGFSVNPSADSSNVVIYLEGGGACFNDYCESIFTPGGRTPGATGIFARGTAGNPVGDWNMVYVPYCSGDVYGGDAETEVAGELRQFRGYRNIEAFLLRWAYWFGDAEQVMLTGSSAGGFGAAINYPQTQDAFGDTAVTLIDDSGPPLGADIFPPCLQATFRDTWGLDGTLLAECGDDCGSDDYIADFLVHVRAEYPQMRGGLFSSLQDGTIRLFAGYGWSDGYNVCGQTPGQIPGPTYQAALMALRDQLEDEVGFGSFFTNGSTHTVLRSERLYEGGAASPAAWIADTLEGSASHVGP